MDVGGPATASTLMRLGLIDEFRLFVHPVILGAGTPLFPALDDRIGLKLLETRTFGSGVVYVPVRDGQSLAERRAPLGDRMVRMRLRLAGSRRSDLGTIDEHEIPPSGREDHFQRHGQPWLCPREADDHCSDAYDQAESPAHEVPQRDCTPSGAVQDVPAEPGDRRVTEVCRTEQACLRKTYVIELDAEDRGKLSRCEQRPKARDDRDSGRHAHERLPVHRRPPPARASDVLLDQSIADTGMERTSS